MESGRGPELKITDKKDPAEQTETGFSEKRAARILEGKRMDNSQVKRNLPAGKQGKPVIFPKQKIIKRAARVEVSKREKILAAHEKNAQALIELMRALGTVAKGALRQEEQLMVEIRARHKLQEELLNALVLEQQGNLLEEALPKELQDLIK